LYCEDEHILRARTNYRPEPHGNGQRKRELEREELDDDFEEETGVTDETEDAEDAEDAPCPQAARLKASTRLRKSAAIRWIFMVLLLCCFGI